MDTDSDIVTRSRASGAMAAPVLSHRSERSVLDQTEALGLVPYEVAGRKRFATCSGVAWFADNHLAVVNLYGGHLRIYRFDEKAAGGPHLTLRHETNEGLSFPEDVAVSPDATMLAITHSISDSHGISLHRFAQGSIIPAPAGITLRLGRAFHGLAFSQDSRHLAFTEIGVPGYIEVVRTDSGERTCQLDNPYFPLKPKSVSFSRDGQFAVMAFAPNVLPDRSDSTARGLLSVHRFDSKDGILTPEPLTTWNGDEWTLGAVESCTTLQAPPGHPFRILAVDQAADVVLAFDCDPNAARLSCAGLFADSMSFPHGIDASADGRRVAIANYGDDSLRILNVSPTPLGHPALPHVGGLPLQDVPVDRVEA